MKRIILTLTTLALSIAAYSQNIIVTNDGDTVKAYNVEIAGNSVYYQTVDSSDSPILKMKNSDILIIKMEDGSKIDPNSGSEATALSPAAPVHAPTHTAANTPEVKAKNDALIADFNRELTWEPDEKFLKKHQNKTGNGYTGIMWIREGSQLFNGDITVSYQRGYNNELDMNKECKFTDYKSNNFMNPMFIIKVKNNTDRMIYLDLASCFVICGEDSKPLYVPVTTMVSNTASNGRSEEYKKTDSSKDNQVKVSSDRKYEEGRSSTYTSVKEAQQYVSIAPKATLSLEPQYICQTDYARNTQLYMRNSYLHLCQNVFPFENTNYGQIIEMEEDESPINLGTCISYSFNENHSAPNTLVTGMYMKYLMCTSSSNVPFAYTIDGDIHKRYPFWVSFYVVPEEKGLFNGIFK